MRIVVSQPELMGIEQVCDYLGENIGKDRVTKLMKTNVIRSVEIGAKGKLVARKSDVDDFIEYMFNKRIDIAGVLESYPLKLNEKIKDKA